MTYTTISGQRVEFEVEDGIFCEHNQWAHDCLACGTRTHGPHQHELLPVLTLETKCIYCDTFTIYFCEHCRASMCGHCVPGTDCPNCNPAAFEGNTMMSAVTAWDDEDVNWHDTKTSYNEEGADEMHPDDCTCQQCADTRELDLEHAIAWMRANNEHGHWTAEIARLERWRAREIPEDVRAMVPAYMTDPHANLDARFSTEGGTDPTSPAYIPPYRASYARLMKALAGAAIIAACLLPSPASAHTGGTHDYPVIGTPAYDASCTIVRECEDGSAVATCGDGYHYVFDADGRFFYMHGIRFWISHENQWHNAPYTPDTLPYTTEGS